MRVNFRQGIVANAITTTFSLGTSGPTFYVNLAVPNPNFPPTFQFADGDRNYLYAFRLAKPDAWGPFLAGIVAYLYVDINTSTGAVSFGSTPLNPVTAFSAPGFVSPTPPLSPAVGDLWKNSSTQALSYWTGSAWADATGQHWYDSLNNQMKVWDGVALQWIRKIRVFAGQLPAGGLPLVSMSINSSLSNANVSYYLGTQVGNQAPNSSGFILFNNNGDALRRMDGTFITTEDVLVAEGVVESAPVTFATNTLAAVAGTSLSAYSMVAFTAPGEVGIMTDLDTNKKVYGIIVESVATGGTVTVITTGIVNNPLWSWPTVNAPLYCDNTGTLTTTRPASAPDPVAAVIDNFTIYLLACDVFVPSDIFDTTYVNVAGDTMTGSLTMQTGATVVLNDAPVFGTDAVNKTYSDTQLSTHATNFTLHLTTNQNGMLDALEAGGNGIVVKNAAATTVTRSLVQPATGMTITNPDGVAAAPTFAFANDLAALEGLATFGFATRTAGDTWTTRTMTGTAGNISVADGDGVSGIPTFDLATVTQAVGGSFLKFTLDGFGRITANTPVLAADVTALISATYVDSTGDTMTGALVHPAGTAAAPSITFTGDLTKGFYDSGAGQVSVAIAGVEKVRFDASGVTTFSGYASGTPGMTLWNVTDPTTGIFFGPVPGTMHVYIAGAPVATFGGPPGPMTALVTSDIGVTVQAWDADLDAISGLGAGVVVLDGIGGAFARTITGTAGNIDVTDGDGVAGNPTIDIAATYVGQTSITTLGTITTGVWNGTAIANANLANSTITVGTTAIALGASSTSLAGITTISMNNQLTSTLATGTAPFVVASTTQVANLNAATAGTADVLTTARTINGTSFDGSANITVTAAAGTLTGATLNATVTGSSLTSVGTITTGTWTGTTIAAINGGTAQTTYATGDTLYASAANTLSKLAVGTAGQVLKVAGGIPTWATMMLKGTTTFDFGSIAANTTDETTITVTGAVSGDPVAVTASALESGLVLTAFVSAADTVTVRLGNVTVGAIDPASHVYQVVVFQYANIA